MDESWLSIAKNEEWDDDVADVSKKSVEKTNRKNENFLPEDTDEEGSIGDQIGPDQTRSDRSTPLNDALISLAFNKMKF